MAHPLRYHPPDAVFEVVHRTVSGEFLFRPSPELNTRIEAVLARAQRLYDVELHNWNVQANHYHLMARAKDLATRTAFLKHIHRNIGIAARELNGGAGPVWAGRAKIRIILDDEAATHRMRYICANGVKEGLVATPTEWPGASAARALIEQRNIVTTWRTSTQRKRLARGVVSMGERNILRITPIAAHAQLSRAARKQQFRRMFDEIVADGHKRRAGRAPLGAAAVRSQSPRIRLPLERRDAPLAFTTSPALLRAFQREYAAHCDWYRASAKLQAAGDFGVRFPPGSIPPPRPFEDRGWPPAQPAV